MKLDMQITLHDVLVVFSDNLDYLDTFQSQIVDGFKPDMQTFGEAILDGVGITDEHNLIIIDLSIYTSSREIDLNLEVEQFCHHNRKNGRCIIVLTTDQHFGCTTDFHRVVLKDN